MLAASAVAFQCFLKANAIWLSKAHWLDAKLGHLPGLPEVVAPDRSWLQLWSDRRLVESSYSRDG